MNIELNFKEGTFVSSKDCLGYQKVIDDFKNSETIRIVTFNISQNKKEDKLFKVLMELDETIDIQIVSNIPARLEWYKVSEYGNHLRRRASSNIDTYLNKLNPEDFNAPIIPFFNFNNHSKIIGTENIVYIGSANFSNESANNYETGVIVRDKEFIKELYKSFFDNLKDKSVPYFTDEFNKLRLSILSISTRLINHYNYFIDTLFLYNERLETYVFIDDETIFSQDDLYKLIYDLYELKEIESLIDQIDYDKYDLEESIHNISNIYTGIDVDSFLDLVDVDSNFYNYVIFSLESTFDNCFQKYSLEAYDEYLNHYVEIASEEARDILYDLCQNVNIDIENIRINLEQIIRSLKEISSIMSDSSNKAVSVGIDNTK